MKTMKNKLIALLLTAVMVIAMFPAMALAADGAKVTVTADKATVEAGDTVTFTVSVTSDVILGILSFNLNIPESVTFVENSGTLLKTASDLGITSGELSFTNISKYYILSDPLGDGNVVGTCDLMTFQCKVNDDATGSISVGITPENACDTSINLVNFDKADATVTVCEHTNTSKVDNGDGTHKIVCDDCGKIVTANQPHTYGTWTPCTDDNTKHQGFCACGNTVTQDHTFAYTHNDTYGKHTKYCPQCDYNVAEDCHGGTATCQSPAQCEDCGEAHGALSAHVFDENAWTDDANGTTHSHKCTVCGAEDSREAEEHNWNEGEVTYPATCETDGVKTYTCTVCNATKTETITKLGHSYTSYTVSSPASCTANAKETATCDHAGCGKTDTREVANSKLPHNFIAEVATSDYLKDAATCQSPAFYFYSCATCGEKDTERYFPYGDLASHNYNVLQSDSLKHWYKCASCSDITGEVSHFGGEATCKDLAVCEICNQPYGIVDESKHTGGTANCVDKAICDVCHQPYGSVDPTNHKSLNTVGHDDATCTADGKTGTGYCSACDTTIGTSEPIKALGHQYGDPTYTWSDDYSSCKATFTCTREGCTDAQKDHAVTVNCVVTSETTTPATCTAKGVKTFTATVTFEGKPYTNTKPVDVDMIDHELENVTGTPATCETPGVKDHFKCKKCDKLFVEKEDSQLLEEVENVTIPAKNHNWVEDEVITLPTCTEKGESSYICLNDRSHTKTEEIPALGHKFGTDGKCTICGVADPNFKPADNTPADPTKPATGDAGVGVWVALLSVSALLGTAIVVKKRHA